MCTFYIHFVDDVLFVDCRFHTMWPYLYRRKYKLRVSMRRNIKDSLVHSLCNAFVVILTFKILTMAAAMEIIRIAYQHLLSVHTQ